MSEKQTQPDYLYVYGLIPKEEITNEFNMFVGISQQRLTVMEYKDIAAIITSVNPQTYSQENIDSLTKDLAWLQENALHHHSCIEKLNTQYTILPMSFCTIFQNDGKLKALLEESYQDLQKTLHFLKGKDEWNLKVYCHPDNAKNFALSYDKELKERLEKLELMPKGKQFLMKKKLELQMEEELVRQFGKWQLEIQQGIKNLIDGSSFRSNWGREVTGRPEEMIMNCDYLVKKTGGDEFINTLKDLEETFSDRGCIFQVTGPWAPYHFAKMGSDQ